jgi:hypothetical protein
MRKLTLVALATLTMVGCAQTPPAPVAVNQPVVVAKEDPTRPVDGVYHLQGYKGPEAMDNQEVVQASKECIFNKMRPNVTYLMVKTDQGKTRVPVSVSCEPF